MAIWEKTNFMADWQSSKKLLAAFLGISSGIVLFVAGSYETKWLLACIMGIVFFFSALVITRDLKFLFTLFAAFSLPVRLDFHLIIRETNYAQLKGLPITIFDLVVFVLFFYWVYQIVQKKASVRFFPIISIPAIIYICLAGLSAFLSEDKVLSFSMFILIVKAYFIFLYFANNIKTKRELFWIVLVLSSGILLQSVIGMLQFVTGGTLGMDMFGEGERAVRSSRVGYALLSRVGGTIGDPNSLAMYLNLILPIMLCFVFTKTKLLLKVAISVIFIMGCLTEVLTLSRGGWLALGVALVVSFYGIFKWKLKSRLKSVVLMFCVILFTATTAIGLFADVRARLFEDDYGSAYKRLPMMEVALNIIQKNPFFGVGLNNYATVMNRYDRTRENISYTLPYPVHNAFLMIAAESGILALIAFLFILLGGFKLAMLFFEGKDQFFSLLGIGWICGILTWIVHAQFRMDFAGINVFLWFSLGMVAALHQLLREEVRQKELKPLFEI